MSPTLEFYRALAEPSASLVVVVGADFRIRWISESVRWIGGYDPRELVGTDALALVHPDDVAVAVNGLTEAATREDENRPVLGRPFPFRLLARHGPIWCEIGGDIRFDDPAVQGMILRIREAPTHELLDRFLDRSVAHAPLGDTVSPLLELLEFEAPGSLAMLAFGYTDRGFEGVVSTISTPTADLLAATIAGTRPEGIPTPEPTGADLLPWASAMEGRCLVSADVDELPASVAAAARETGHVACWCQPVTATTDTATACLILWREITGQPWVGHDVAMERTARLAALAVERREYERRLVHAATRDPLTGLLNRRAFYEALDRCTVGEPLAVLYIDLDGFKPVNDAWGHDAGDTVLRVMAERLRLAVRGHDIAARLGGDEFAILLGPPCTRDDAEAISARLLEAATAPIEAGPSTVRVGVSVGVAVAEDADSHHAPAALLDRADAAMYRAKKAGGGRWRLAAVETGGS